MQTKKQIETEMGFIFRKKDCWSLKVQQKTLSATNGLIDGI